MRRKLLLWFCFAGCLHLAGCAKTDFRVTSPPSADDPASQPLPEPQRQGQPETAAASHELVPDASYPIPALTTDELLQYIRQLAIQEPRGDSEEELLADQISRAKSQLVAAERILRQPDLETTFAEAATKAKLDTLRLLAILDADGLGKDYQPFLRRLQETGPVRMRLLGNISQLEFELDRLGLGQESEPGRVTARVEEVLQVDGLERPEFFLTQYAGVALDEQGFTEEATHVFNLVGNYFANAADAALVKDARSLQQQTAFRNTLLAALVGGDAERKRLVEEIQSLVKEKTQLTQPTLDRVLRAGQLLEYRGRLEAAGAIFRSVGSAFENADERLAAQADRAARNAAKRLGLIGNAITIQGVHPDGTSFAWDRFQGKVVLLDFWATWSGPWHERLAELKDTFEQFHNEGFEVVGVNLDESKDDLYEYLRQHGLPWPVVIDETGGGLGNVNAVRYGVDVVPFAILVGRDGKAANIHVRGEALKREVALLLQGEKMATSSKVFD